MTSNNIDRATEMALDSITGREYHILHGHSQDIGDDGLQNRLRHSFV